MILFKYIAAFADILYDRVLLAVRSGQDGFDDALEIFIESEDDLAAAPLSDRRTCIRMVSEHVFADFHTSPGFAEICSRKRDGPAAERQVCDIRPRRFSLSVILLIHSQIYYAASARFARERSIGPDA